MTNIKRNREDQKRYHYRIFRKRHEELELLRTHELVFTSYIFSYFMFVCFFSFMLIDTAPSFEEMGESIDDIVRQHRQGVVDVDDVSISVHQQLVLACAWLNLKVSFELLDHSNWLRFIKWINEYQPHLIDTLTFFIYLFLLGTGKCLPSSWSINVLIG